MSCLWAITCFFNPAGYVRRKQNYQVFRRYLTVPLAAVELSQDGRFELEMGDAEILLQVRGGDVMWQKERLLNIAVSILPKECDHVAWLDCDGVFQREDWASAAVRELERTRLCQLFRTMHHLSRDIPVEAAGSATDSISRESIGYACASGVVTSVASPTDPVPNVYKRGNAWCARRDLLAEHGLYDRNIIGGGDKMIAFAATGQMEEVIARNGMSPAHADDYRGWASRFRRDVQGMGYVDGDLYHLWHGDLERRRYGNRHSVLRSLGYDPAADIALNAERCWRWNSVKPELHRQVRDYFWQRDEDGRDRTLESQPA
jgi:hypothetical protein